MSDLFSHPKPGTLSCLLRRRYDYFNTGENLEFQINKARGFLDCDQDAIDAVTEHATNFFARSRMCEVAELHDLETDVMWAKLARNGKTGAGQKEAFYRLRLNLGVLKIRSSKRKFDLQKPESEAFYGFYINSLQWHLLDLVIKPSPMDGDFLMDAVTAEDFAISAHFMDCGASPLTDSPSGRTMDETIARLAIQDLPKLQRPVARRLLAGGKFSNADDHQRRLMHTVRCNLRLLCSALSLVQTPEGINAFRRVVMRMESKDDHHLLLEHFTKSGPESRLELFSGRPLDDLASSVEAQDNTGDAVRLRLLKCLSDINVSVVVEETQTQALAALPQREQAVLKTLYFIGGGWDADEPRPDWSPIEWDVEGRKAVRALKRLQTLYLRALNGKSLHRLLNDPRLNWEQMELLKLHLVEPRKRANSLLKIAAQRRVTLEGIKKALMETAELIIDL